MPEELHYSIPEVEVYLVESAGNSTRIDYGSGHEMSFVMFLYCLFKIGYFSMEDQAATGVVIFDRYFVYHTFLKFNFLLFYLFRYIALMRKLQLTYRMEPAGSHGVWSLDDYQFVPFIWGSSQLIGSRKNSFIIRIKLICSLLLTACE